MLFCRLKALWNIEYSFRLRNLLTNNRLYKMGLVESMKCSRCQAAEDLKHVFWTYPEVSTLCMESLVYWLGKTFNIYLKWDPRTCLFGLLDDTIVATVVWLCLLLGKHSIWQARWNQLPLTIEGCLQKIRDIKDLEKLNATKTKIVSKHERKWGPLSSRVEQIEINHKTVLKEVNTSDLYRL